MRMRIAAVAGVLACAGLLGGAPRAANANQESGSLDRAAARQTFQERIERYAALRARYAAPLPPFDQARRDPWSLRLSRLFLASAIRTGRPAVLGDIFTPPVAALFRTVIADAVYSVDIEGLVDDRVATEALVDLAVNEPVPAWAMATPPGALLTRLPSLPPAIEYRLVGETLVLWDADAEILIDALPGALIVE